MSNSICKRSFRRPQTVEEPGEVVAFEALLLDDQVRVEDHDLALAAGHLPHEDLGVVDVGVIVVRVLDVVLRRLAAPRLLNVRRERLLADYSLYRVLISSGIAYSTL